MRERMKILQVSSDLFSRSSVYMLKVFAWWIGRRSALVCT
jgi:hypothetical protein